MPDIGIGIGIGIGLGPSDETDGSITAEDDMKVTKYTLTYADLAAAALTGSVTLATLPAGTVLHLVKLKHSAAFTGGAVASCKATVGIAGELDRYLGKQTPFDVFQAPGGTVFALASGPWEEDHSAALAVKLALTVTGANLNALTAGSVDVWLATTAEV